jgi:hypothetical protein
MRPHTASIQPVEPATTRGRAISVGRLAGWSLVVGLAGAAAWGVVVLLSSSVNETDARVILTSLGFAATSTTGASGVAAALRTSWGLRALGVATIGCSIVAFGLLTVVIWRIDFAWNVPEIVWRGCACASVLAIAGGHASLMLRGRKPTDSALVEVVTLSSLAFGSIDAVGALLPLAEIVDEVDESWARILGSVLVLLIATTVAAPILRRVQAAGPLVPGAGRSRDSAEALASDVIRTAERIDVLNGDPGNRAPEIRAEVNRLRNLAQSVGN